MERLACLVEAKNVTTDEETIRREHACTVIGSYDELMQMRPYEKLIVWRQSYALCLEIYKMTRSFPSDERFGLVSQMRRAAYSVPLNLAEGTSRHSRKERRRFGEIAKGSLEELHCQSRLARDLGYLPSISFEKIDQEVQRISYLLFQFMNALK